MARLIHDYVFNDPFHFERVSSKSITVPDQSLTIQQIFNRLRNGMSLDLFQRSGYYDDPDDFNDDFDTVNPLELDPDLTTLPSPYEVDD